MKSKATPRRFNPANLVALTSAEMDELDRLHRSLGQEQFDEIQRQVWNTYIALRRTPRGRYRRTTQASGARFSKRSGLRCGIREDARAMNFVRGTGARRRPRTAAGSTALAPPGHALAGPWS
jgi:hypothetical protein